MATDGWREISLHNNIMWARVDLVYPDKFAYEKKKGINVIENGKLDKAQGSTLDFPEWLPEELRMCWKLYHAALIEYACGDKRFPVSRIFPGVHIPGPQGGVDKVGSTAWQVFLHALTMKQRVVDPRDIKVDGNTYYYSGNRPPVSIDAVPDPEFWPWRMLTIPKIEKFQLLDFSQETEANELRLFLVTEITLLFQHYHSEANRRSRLKLVRRIFSLVHLVQNPYAPIPTSAEIVNEGDRILRKLLEKGSIRNLVPLLFQIESELTYLDSILKRGGLSAFGYFENSWVAICKIPLQNLFETEMVGVERTADEILTIVSEGAWAPIVTDEHLNNTDGSHRAIAAWVWNLTHWLAKLGKENLDLGSEEITAKVRKFFAEMGSQPLVRRETLKVLGHILADPKYATVKEILFGAVKNQEVINDVYVLLLPERQACCVLKKPFDEEGVVIGLPSPFVYQELRRRGNCAIGERGPYHRTDRNLLPLVKY